MKRCVFFDRDGVVNASPGAGYVERVSDFHLQQGFLAAAKVALVKGYDVAIATNQRGVARGIMTQQTLDHIHAHMVDALKQEGIPLLGVYCCMHERDSCTCRKPQPGLLLQAADEHDLDLSACWMVGDRETDVEAGRQAGCRTILVGEDDGRSLASYTVADINALPECLQKVL